MSGGIELTLTDEQLKSALSHAVLTKMDDKMKDQIISSAIAHLTTKQGQGYFGQKTPLEEAFNRAIGAFANEIARDYVQADPRFRAAVRDLLDKTASAALEQSYQLRRAVTEAVVASIEKRDEEDD